MGKEGRGALQVTLFGAPQLSWCGEPVTPPTRKGTALVCYLAARAEPVERVDLAELLWGTGSAGLRNLRWEIHQLRRLPGAQAWLDAAPGSPTVAVRALTDLARFTRAATAGSSAEALQVYGHPSAPQFLAGLSPRGAPAFTDWLEDERARLERWLHAQLRNRADELEAAGDLARAQELLSSALQLDPLDEGAHRSSIRVALLQGDIGAASARYEACRRLLAEELGLEPTAETLELAAAIERAHHVSSPMPLAARRRMPAELLRPPLLVGREREWSRALAAWERHQIIFVSGPPGVGKSRFAQDLIRAQVGEDVAVLRGFPGDEVVPFSGYERGWRGVFTARPELREQLPAWVRAEVARFLPGLFEEERGASAAPADALRFASALRKLYRQLLTNFGAALVDDIQYFDPASWRLGGSALREIYADPTGRERLGRMITCFRSDEMPPAFVRGIEGLVAAGVAIHIELAPLDEAAVAELLNSLGMHDAHRQASHYLRLTGGNPLFVLEVLRRLAESAEWQEPADPSVALAAHLPEQVHQLIWSRLNRLPLRALRVAQALAVLQEAASRDRLRALINCSGTELEEDLMVLEQQQVVVGLRFSHDLLQESVIRGLPEPTACGLHAAAAALLEAENGAASLIAHHWKQAGEPARAVPHFLHAAQEARSSGATENVAGWVEYLLRHATGETRRSALELRATSVQPQAAATPTDTARPV